VSWRNEWSKMAQRSHRCAPALPEQCYSACWIPVRWSSSSEVRQGITKQIFRFTDKESAKQLVAEYNEKLGVTKAQSEAMKAGSMFGFEVPGADPKNYDENGTPIKPKQKDRGDAR
jgi:hypothetical protein